MQHYVGNARTQLHPQANASDHSATQSSTNPMARTISTASGGQAHGTSIHPASVQNDEGIAGSPPTGTAGTTPSINTKPMTKRTKKRFANWLSLGVAISGAILAVSDTITSMNLIPKYLSNAWGLVLATSLIINRVGSILTHPAHTEEDPKP